MSGMANSHGSENQNKKRATALAAIKADSGDPRPCPYHRGSSGVFAGSWFLDDPAGVARAFGGLADGAALAAAS